MRDGTGKLPPFSGDGAACLKCSYGRVSTKYRASGEVPDEVVAVSFGDAWPERLERECGRCEYRWDEQLNPPRVREGEAK